MPRTESTAAKLDRIEAKLDVVLVELSELRALVSDTQAAAINASEVGIAPG